MDCSIIEFLTIDFMNQKEIILITGFKKTIFTLLCVGSLKLMAGGNPPIVQFDDPDHSWSLITSIGFTDYNHMMEKDGQTPLLRLGFGKRLFFVSGAAVGLELGIQNGNTMDVDTTAFPETGGLPVSTTVKPTLDLLATVKTGTLGHHPFFLLAKGGVAYYHWQFDNNDVMKNQIKLATEAQAGVGYIINDFFDLSLLYQGIFGGNPNLHLENDYSNRLTMNNIPVQHGVLLSLSFNF